MNQEHRDKLKEILKDNDEAVDNTSIIREQQYSDKIQLDIEKLIIFKNKNKELLIKNKEDYDFKLRNECSFISSTYPEMFNKLKDDSMDMKLMFKFINIYREIETGKIDQHEASFKVGTILKEMYVDTAINNEPKNKQSRNVNYKDWIEKKNIIEKNIGKK